MTWGSWGWRVLAVLISTAAPAFAQTPDGSVDLGAHAGVLRLSEFDVTDAGVGVDATWRATPIVSLNGAITWFPGGGTSTGGARVAGQQRVLGLIGARSGIRRGQIELFGRARAGFLRFSEADRAVCVAVTIVPLPLECQIATGYTAFATDLGGGLAVQATPRVQLRFDAGDVMVRYGQDAYRRNGEPTDGFTSHNLQVSAGLAWRF